MDKVTQVIAWALTVTFAVVILMGTYDANALTLKKGEVLTSNGVVHASESANTHAQVERNGYAVVAGLVIIGVGDEQVTVDVNDIRGKSRGDIVELIGDAAADQLEGSVADEIAAAVAQGVHSEISEDLVDLLGEQGVAQMLADEASGGSCPECTLSDADFAEWQENNS